MHFCYFALSLSQLIIILLQNINERLQSKSVSRLAWNYAEPNPGKHALTPKKQQLRLSWEPQTDIRAAEEGSIGKKSVLDGAETEPRA